MVDEQQLCASVSRSAASTNRSSTLAKRERDIESPTATTMRDCAINSVYAYLQRQARNTTQGSDESRRLSAVSAFRSRVAHSGARNVTTLPGPASAVCPRVCVRVHPLPSRAVTTPSISCFSSCRSPGTAPPRSPLSPPHRQGAPAPRTPADRNRSHAPSVQARVSHPRIGRCLSLHPEDGFSCQKRFSR